MIITVNDILNSGLPISDDIRASEIENAIEVSEFFWLKSLIGDEKYIDLNNDPISAENYLLLHGGVYENKYLAGIKRALINYTFSYLILNNIRATRFGSVYKTDEFSENANTNNLQFNSRYYREIAEAYIRELDGIIEIKQGNDTNRLLY